MLRRRNASSLLQVSLFGAVTAVTMLSNLAGRIENYPELKARIEQHVEETRRQSSLIEQCLQSLGSDSSMLKDAGTKLMGLGQGLSGIFTSDEVAKGVLATYAFEHMEIASYRMLIGAAKQVGEPEVQRVCEEILQEELAMAGWLEDNLDTITQKFLAREGMGVTAKH